MTRTEQSARRDRARHRALDAWAKSHELDPSRFDNGQRWVLFAALNALKTLGPFAPLQPLTTIAHRAWPEGSPKAGGVDSMPNEHLAFALYLEHPDYIEVAESIFDLDSYTANVHEYAGHEVRPWGLEDLTPLRPQLRAMLDPFLANQAFGKHLVIEDCVLSDRVLLWVYLQSPLTYVDEIVADGCMVSRPQRFVVQLALCYRWEESLLRVYTPSGSPSLAHAVQRAFAALYLQDGHFFAPVAPRSDLDFRAISKGRWSFTDGCTAPVVAAWVTSLTLRQGSDDVVVRSRRSLPEAVDAQRKYPLAAYEIHSVTLKFVLRHGRRRERVRIVVLEAGHLCSLRDDPWDRVIEEHLLRWGLLRGRVHYRGLSHGTMQHTAGTA